MRILICLSLLCHLWSLAVSSSSATERVVTEVDWSESVDFESLPGAKLVKTAQADGEESLRIEHLEDGPTVLNLLTLESPDISKLHYALRGRIRYWDVQGQGYLEMWSHFPNGGAYFSRTLGTDGPMQCLQGTGQWRDSVLPFFSSEEAGTPSKLVVNLVLAGPGTVELGPFEVVEYDDVSLLTASIGTGSWWNWPISAWIGAVGGPLIGCLGALAGILTSLGVARRVAIGTMVFIFVAGCVTAAAGLIAVLNGQPYFVFYPLLLLGVISVAVAGPLIFVVRRRFEQQELRRMTAMDTCTTVPGSVSS